MLNFGNRPNIFGQDCRMITELLVARDPFLESSSNLPGPISVFGDKCF